MSSRDTRSSSAKKLSRHAQAALVLAHNIAVQHKQQTVSPFHVLYAISQQPGAAGAALLRTLSLSSDVLLRECTTISRSTRGSSNVQISQPVKDALVRAYTLAGATGYPYVGTEHIAHAILSSRDSAVQTFVTRHSITIPPLQPHAATAPIQNLSTLLGITTPESSDTGESALEHFTRDLTAAHHHDTSLVGRDDLLNDIIAILVRKEKCNPLLVGEAGVGKTALVEGLAKRIAAGTVPAPLLDTRIVSLDVADLVAGTTYRGEFEARIKDLLSDIEEDSRQTILFIDEIHTIVGAGNANGSLDAANILKPALSRGTIRVIGATTHAEYKKHISKDRALVRRFQRITVPEPSRDDTCTILRTVREHYANHHNVTIPAALIPSIVDLSIRYIPARHLPDKAFDILDESCAMVQRDTADAKHIRERISIRNELRRCIAEKTQAIATENYADALILRKKEQQLREQYMKYSAAPTKNRATLSLEVVRRATARIAHIPESSVTTDRIDTARMRALDVWARTVVGQPEAVRRVRTTLRRAFAHLHDPERPLASFLFLGPSGTGKTFAATELSRVIGTTPRDALIRIDMSELSERHSGAKLIGAPAGYVGYGEGGTLTERVRTTPHSVILFDEIEKAHPSVLTLLLQILDTGTLTDSTGTATDFRHTVVVLTSNIGSTDTVTGFANTSHHKTAATLRELREHIAPEILNRIDDIVPFVPLNRAALTRIARTELRALRTRTARHGQRLIIDRAVAPHIARTVATQDDRNAQARAIAHRVRTDCADAVANCLLDSPTTDAVTLHVCNGTICATPSPTHSSH